MTPPESKTPNPPISRLQGAKIKCFLLWVLFALVLVTPGILFVVRPWASGSIHPNHSMRYLGVCEPNAPTTYAGVEQFAQAIGRQPNLAVYYSSWLALEPFQVTFATLAAKHGAMTVVQIDPKNVSLASIADGKYDAYLHSYAAAVKAFGSKVVLSFGHEMNGNWYSWGNQHTSPNVFVAAWRHIVNVFRAASAKNVIWLWTVNVIDNSIPIPNPAPWWPGNSYVNWVGIDGYYYTPSLTFSQAFGPTIVDVRGLTSDPILIAETGATPVTGQSAKITDLFAGVQSYGLLGFVWFDVNSTDTSNGEPEDWRLDSPTAFGSFRRDAKAFMAPSSTSVSLESRIKLMNTHS